jgi:predicted dehydrogenase
LNQCSKETKLPEKTDIIRLAHVGYGYWGRNLLRVFASAKNAKVVACCEVNPEARKKVAAGYPQIELCDDYAALLQRDDIDAVILATPAEMHYEQTLAALKAGKHVFVEKPLTRTIAEAEEVVGLAKTKNLTLMVGHTFLFNDAVQWVKDYIDSGEMGEIYYSYFQRLNLGRVRQDVNALWNLAPHDISIALYWFGENPDKINAHGVSYLQDGIDDLCFLNLNFPSGRFAHIHVSWLDPFKTRSAVIVGSKKMVVYDDTSPDQRIQVFDKGIDRKQLDTQLEGFDTFDQFQLVQRAGDIWIPRIQFREPLMREAQHFVDCLHSGATPISDGTNGLEVVRVLETASPIGG